MNTSKINLQEALSYLTLKENFKYFYKCQSWIQLMPAGDRGIKPKAGIQSCWYTVMQSKQ